MEVDVATDRKDLRAEFRRAYDACRGMNLRQISEARALPRGWAKAMGARTTTRCARVWWKGVGTKRRRVPAHLTLDNVETLCALDVPCVTNDSFDINTPEIWSGKFCPNCVRVAERRGLHW